MTPSAMLRLMLSKVCPGQIEPGELPTRATKEAPLFLRLRPDEVAEVRRRAKLEGTTGPSWVRRVVLAIIRRAPSFTRTEETALLESNRELLAIGRNINQIAHHLNIHPDATDRVNAQVLAELSASIKQHREIVAQLVNASWGRYSLEDLDAWEQ